MQLRRSHTTLLVQPVLDGNDIRRTSLVRFLILDACKEDRSASSLDNASIAFAPLTPCPHSEPQVSTRILNLSVITHHRPSSSLSSSSEQQDNPQKNQHGFDSWDRSPM